MKINNISGQPVSTIKKNNNIKAQKSQAVKSETEVKDKSNIKSPFASDLLTITSHPPFEDFPSIPINEQMAEEVTKNVTRQISTADNDVIPAQAKFELKRVLSLLD